MVHGESGCQLYLILPSRKDSSGVSDFLEGGDLTPFACLLLQAQSGGIVDRDFAGELLTLAHGANIPLLLENDIPAAAELGADGVHIPADENLYARARDELGDDAIIGVDCGQSRHAGLTFAELGANYIAFSGEGPVADDAIKSHEELIAWWGETVTVPCVAWEPESLERAQLLAETGADFAAISEPFWSHEEGPAAAATALRTRLEKPRMPA